MQEKKFCHLCGSRYISSKQQPWHCSGCGNLSYLVSSPTAEIALFNEKGEVLLAKRGIEPNKGKYDLPGGFLNLDEIVEDAVVREVKEELGLEHGIDYETPRFVLSWCGDSYRFSVETLHTLNMVFAAKLIGVPSITPQDDVAGFMFVSVEELDASVFSYEHYPHVIAQAKRALFES